MLEDLHRSRLGGSAVLARSLMPVVAGLAAAALLIGSAVNGPAHAETLADALGAAYKFNPQLDAERARLRATDEEVPRAMSGYRPTLSGALDYGVRRSSTKPSSPADGRTYPKGYRLDATQPLFRGFRTRNTIKSAEANVRAGRELLRQTEQTVLLSAVQAYVDVIRDTAVVRLRQSNVIVLSKELKATKDRFAVGEVTRTDVAQASARRALAVAALDLARSNLRTSAATYEQVIGHVPARLRSPAPHRRLLPSTIRDAVEVGLRENPAHIRALYQEAAARSNVDTIRGELLPTAQLEANFTHRYNVSKLTQQTRNGSLVGRINIPFYQGGAVMARIRQAKQSHLAQLQVVKQIRTEVKSSVISAWSQLVAAKAAVRSDMAAVKANQIALAGVRAEERVGQRTLLEILNAQQELLDTQVTLVSDQRNEVFASYNLLSALGRLSANELNVAERVYDADAHYHEVRRKWWGIAITHADGRREEMDLWESHGRRAEHE